MLVTTHYLDEAEHCHRIAIIQAGRMAALGTASELKQVFKTRPIVEIRVAQPVEAMAFLDRQAGIEKTSLFGTAVHAVLKSDALTPDAVASLLKSANIDVQSIGVVSPSLEDVFLDVVERAGAA